MLNNYWCFMLGAIIGSILAPTLYCLWFWNPKNVEKRKAKLKIEETAYERSFTKWLRENWDEDNMLTPSLSAEDAIVFLKNYLLGPDWYVNYPGSSGQIVTEITYDILKKHSKKFRKEKECEKNGFR